MGSTICKVIKGIRTSLFCFSFSETKISYATWTIFPMLHDKHFKNSKSIGIAFQQPTQDSEIY